MIAIFEQGTCCVETGQGVRECGRKLQRREPGGLRLDGRPTTADTRIATIVVSVSPAQVATISATATTASTTSDPDSANNSATATTTVQTFADLAITLTDSPDPVTAGTELTYVATVTNAGLSDAQDVSTTLPLPAGTSFVAATPTAGGSCATESLVVCTWTGGTAPGAIRSVSIVVAVDPAHIANPSATATVASATSDPIAANNTATATTTVLVSADISTSLVDSPDPVAAGTNITYTVTVTDNGPSAATGVSTSMAVPANTSFVSGSVAGGGSCSGSPVMYTFSGSIAPGVARIATLIFAVNAATADGSLISATANVSSASPDANAANNSAIATTTVRANADLALTLNASVTSAAVNVPVAFTASSLNLGPSDAQNVSISITLTPDFRYSAHTPSAGATCTTPQVATSGVITCTWAGPTAPGATRTLAVQCSGHHRGQRHDDLQYHRSRVRE